MRRHRTLLSRESREPRCPDDASAQQKLDAARAQLEAFKRHYTPEHPDVKALERQIADLQVKADLEAKMPPQKKPLSPAEVARQKRLKELQTELDMIDREIASELADIAILQEGAERLPRQDRQRPLARDRSHCSDARLRDVEEVVRRPPRKAAGVEHRRKSGASSDRRAVEDRGSRVLPREAEQSEGTTRGPVWWRDWRTGPRRHDGQLPRVSRFEFQDRRRCGSRAGASGSGAHPRDGCRPAARRATGKEGRCSRRLHEVMYQAFYGLRELPFELTPNPKVPVPHAARIERR